MFPQCVVHAHARQPDDRRLPTQPKTSARPSAAERGPARGSDANANPPGYRLKARRSSTFQLTASPFRSVSHEIPRFYNG